MTETGTGLSPGSAVGAPARGLHPASLDVGLRDAPPAAPGSPSPPPSLQEALTAPGVWGADATGPPQVRSPLRVHAGSVRCLPEEVLHVRRLSLSGPALLLRLLFGAGLMSMDPGLEATPRPPALLDVGHTVSLSGVRQPPPGPRPGPLGPIVRQPSLSGPHGAGAGDKGGRAGGSGPRGGWSGQQPDPEAAGRLGRGSLGRGCGSGGHRPARELGPRTSPDLAAADPGPPERRPGPALDRPKLLEP